MKKENIEIDRNERRGIYWILVLYVISWGILVLGNNIMRLIAWFSLGLIGFSLWHIISGLFDRIDNKKENGVKGGEYNGR